MLRQHPEVYVPKTKELHFFDKEPRYSRGLDWYAEFFAGARGEKARGEFTPNYFWTTPDETEKAAGGADNKRLPERVQHALPDLRLVVILREPVQRAVSAYFHHIRARRLPVSERLTDAGDKFGIRSMGHYAEHLEHWQACFPKERFLILFYEEDIAKNKERTLSRVFDFIGVDSSFVPSGLDRRVNRRRSPLHMRLNFYVPWLANGLDFVLPEAVTHARPFRINVAEDEREQLAEHYRPHNERLKEMLGRPLPW
jgi:hypothetical protein